MVEIDKCCITHWPSPVLCKAAEPVEEITDEIRGLAEKMIDIMLKLKGIGLAGPQAGVGLCIFVVSTDATMENTKVYINPQIETSGKLETNEEGCLSLPGIYAKIKRFSKCKITAIGLDGNQFTEQVQGLVARAFQHEFDHLEGILIKDRMSQVAKIAARKRLRYLQENYEKNRSFST